MKLRGFGRDDEFNSGFDFGLNSHGLVEKGSINSETVPQRLKPQSKKSNYGTVEAVPLSKTEYFNKFLVQFLLQFRVQLLVQFLVNS